MKWWPFRRTRKSPRLLALLGFRNEMAWLPDYFESVRPLVDGIVALDDGSTDGSGDFVEAQPEVLELSRLPPRKDHQWDDGLNHRRLIEAAWQHQPDWLLGLDADERLEAGFRERADEVIARAGKLRAFRLHVREVWDDPLSFRVDGVWGTKSSARLFEARRDHEFDMRRFHGYWAPLNSQVDGGFPLADLILYHLRMMRPEDREARRARYEALDPESEFQSIGYAYMTDPEGLRLARAPAGREYRPLPGPSKERPGA